MKGIWLNRDQKQNYWEDIKEIDSLEKIKEIFF
jgi:hypothetical protein